MVIKDMFFQCVSNKKGFVMLDIIIISMMLMMMVGSIYFFQVNAENYRNCKAKIIAEYNADMYLDQMAIMHCNSCNTSFISNNIEFFVEEKVAENIALVRISWNLNNKMHCIIRERRNKI